MSDKVISINASAEKRLDVLRDERGRLLLTPDQKKAVLERGRILVSASAGSGKTSTMVKRIILMIAEGASLKDLLILVYNNAAADELKEKLHQELFRVACSAEGDLREHFRGELDDIAFCHICTIHAFCQSLIRENFDKLGISPSFEVLDERAHATYINKALDETIAQYTQEGDETFLQLIEIFSQSRRDDNLKSNLIKLYNLVEIQPSPTEFEECVNECYSSFENSKFIEILQRCYIKFFKKANIALGKLREDMLLVETTIAKYIEAVTARLYISEQMSNATSLEQICKIASCFEKPSARISQKATDEERVLVDYAKEYFAQFDAVIKELVALYEKFDVQKEYFAQNGKFVRKLTEAVFRFREKLAELKQKDSVLSFEDLQHKAMQLLQENPSLGEAFDAVFVDEYQDVNPTQEAIISKLVKGECFMVGDVKQSIYGFRLADPQIFLSRQKRYADFANKEGQNVFFNHNFRSAYGILDFVNGVFDSAMTEDSADIDYKQEARFELKEISPVNIENIPPIGRVEVHLFEKNKPESKVASGIYDITKDDEGIDEDDGNSQDEGRFIANEIRSLVGRMKDVDENGVGKRLDYSDIAVLFRSRSTGARQIIDVLKKEGIPVNEGAFGKSASLPERELVCMLKTLDNPRQDIAFAGYLLSFFGGYDESELAKIASLKGECLYDKFLEYSTRDDDLAMRARDTLDELTAYRLKGSYQNVAQLMNSIVCDYCYDAYLMKGGEGNVSGLKSFIASANQKENLSLGKFLEDYSEEDNDAVGASGDGRVTISTFHGYKGLEKPVVFVADTAFLFNYEASVGDLIATGKGIGTGNDKGLVGLNAYDFDNKTKCTMTLSKCAVAKCVKDNQVKEEIRLFYVALTRAKQVMYVTATATETKCATFGSLPKISAPGCDLDFISGALFDGSVNVPVFKHAITVSDEKEPESKQFVFKTNDKIIKTIEQSTAFEYPYKEATRLSMKYSVSALDSLDDEAICLFQESAKRGTAYHKVMQYIDYFALGKEAVEGEMARMINEKLITEEERALVNSQDISDCLDSEIMQLARKATMSGAGGCLREQSFMMYKSAQDVSEEFASSDKVLVQGVVDLFINGEKRIIVDFKNSALKDEQSLERYKKQLYLYKSAIESAICAKIDRLVLYSFKSGKTIDL